MKKVAMAGLAGVSPALTVLLTLVPARAADRDPRAFVVGIQRYSDGYIQRLERAADDARDVARDLGEVGYDKKNVKLLVDLPSREAFEKEFRRFSTRSRPATMCCSIFRPRLRGGGRSDQLSAVRRPEKSFHLREVATDRSGTQERRRRASSDTRSFSTPIRRMKSPKAFRKAKSSAASRKKIPTRSL